MKKLYIIDGNSLMNRAFYALPPLSNANGVYSNAVFGFVNCLVKLITENKPDYMIVAFDHAKKTFRNEMFAEYKANRKGTPIELVSQFPLIKEVLDVMGITHIEQLGIEADDIIGTITKNSVVQSYIITGDRDSLQLVDDNISVWLTQKGISEIKEVNISNIQELYNLTPMQVIDYKALAGDSSDNIPGVAGVGEKTAISLINQFDNIENIYNNLDQLKGKLKEKIELSKDICFLSKQLATIKTNCELDYTLEKCTFNFPFNQKVKEIFEKYNFNSLLKRTTLFSAEETESVIKQDSTIIIDVNVLKQLLSNYNNDVFAFNINQDEFNFYMDNKRYVTNANLLNLDLVNFYLLIQDLCNNIFNNNQVLKIVSDLKNHMHILNINNITNVFDISLSSYLINGGNKPEIFKDCSEYFSIYKQHLQKMEELNLLDLYNKIELPLINVLYNMEKQGFALNKKTLDNLSVYYKEELNNLDKEIKSYSSNEKLNIKSPKQISEFLFDELKISDKNNKKRSTNVEKLQLIIDEHPVVALILRHRKVAKLYSTYIEPYQQILKESNDNLIHTIFNQMLTATGRLSSSEPNLQNIPVRSEEGRSLRKMFISSFEGGNLISADYNQIELRLLANFSKDYNLIADYNKGTDIHSLTASQIFAIAPNEVTDLQRRVAKAVNFGIIYGISGFGLAKNIDISVNDAKRYIDIYFEKYPAVKQYLDNLILDAKNTGFAKSIFGRIRNIPELQSSNGMQRALGERIAMNMPLQGSASDIIKLAMLNVYNRLKKEQLKSKLILQIHDELIVDVYPGEEDTIINILKEEMENVYQFNVPLIVSIGIGTTWYECK